MNAGLFCNKNRSMEEWLEESIESDNTLSRN